MHRQPPALLAALLALPFALQGCYSLAEPSFDPGSQRDVLASIVRRGIVVSDVLPGRAACDDPDVVGNSLYLAARLPHEEETRDVFVHTYRERSWEASAEEVDACQADYAEDHPDVEVARLDIPTYRAFGADWSDELTEELRAALEEASQAG